MKDYSWLAVFSVFTLIVGFIFTYGNVTRADLDPAPVQVFVTSTTTPSSAVVVREQGGGYSLTPPAITVNVMIATSTMTSAAQESVTKTPSSYTYHITNNTYATSTTTPPVEETDTISLSVEGVYVSTTTPIVAGETVLALLARLDAADPVLDLATQDYGDMGILVTAMGGLVNGTDGNYWQYQVDGTAPMVGADAFELQDGQTVVWEFKGF